MFTPKQRWLLFSALLLLLGLIRDLLLNLLAGAIQLDSSARGWLLAGIVLLLVGTLAMSYRHWQLESDASALSKVKVTQRVKAGGKIEGSAPAITKGKNAEISVAQTADGAGSSIKDSGPVIR